MVSGSLKSLLVAVLSLVMVFFSNVMFAQDKQPVPTHDETTGTKKENKDNKEDFDAGSEILHHIMDSHEFHIFSAGSFHATLNLPILVYSDKGFSVFSSARFGEEGTEVYNGYKLAEGHIVAVREDGTVDEAAKVYDFSITKNVFQMFIALIILVVIMLNMAKKYKLHGSSKAPSGFQNALEPVILFVRDEVARPNLGTNANKYLPYLLTVFFFILVNNIFGLIPGSANVTGNTSFTLMLALISLIVILFSTNRHFWGHIFWPPGVPFLVKLILIPVELFGTLVVKPGALMVRLFANMAAGHIVILSFVSLIFIFGQMSTGAGWGFTPVSMAFAVFIYLIEILVAFIQAFIFTNLTAVFISQSFEGDKEHGGHDDPVII